MTTPERPDPATRYFMTIRDIMNHDEPIMPLEVRLLFDLEKEMFSSGNVRAVTSSPDQELALTQTQLALEEWDNNYRDQILLLCFLKVSAHKEQGRTQLKIFWERAADSLLTQSLFPHHTLEVFDVAIGQAEEAMGQDPNGPYQVLKAALIYNQALAMNEFPDPVPPEIQDLKDIYEAARKAYL